MHRAVYFAEAALADLRLDVILADDGPRLQILVEPGNDLVGKERGAIDLALARRVRIVRAALRTCGHGCLGRPSPVQCNTVVYRGVGALPPPPSGSTLGGGGAVCAVSATGDGAGGGGFSVTFALTSPSQPTSATTISLHMIDDGTTDARAG